MTRCKSEHPERKHKDGRPYRCCLNDDDEHKNGHICKGIHWPVAEGELKVRKKRYKPSRHELWLNSMSAQEKERKGIPDEIHVNWDAPTTDYK